MAKKAVKRKKTPTRKATPAKKTKPAVGRKKAAPKRAAPKPPLSLGRPKVTAEEKLYLLFKDDYHARQIFEFLRAETVRDLEQFSPAEIVGRLSQPIRQTVDRIRKKLAEKNRCLKDDLAFAVEHASDAAEVDSTAG
jgi:hypothetical protein